MTTLDTISSSLSTFLSSSPLLSSTISSLYSFLFSPTSPSTSPKTLKYLQYLGLLYLLKKSISLSFTLFSYLSHSLSYLHSRTNFYPPEFKDRFGVKYWTLVVGVDGELGREFCRVLAGLGFDLVLVGTNKRVLEERVKEVRGVNEYVRVKVVGVDLFYKGDPVEKIAKETQGLDIGLVINNTQLFTYESFEKISRQTLANSYSSNISTLLKLSHLLVPKMSKRPYKSGIINVTSAFGVIPTPYTGTFSPYNFYSDMFSRGLAEEYRGKIEVLSLRMFNVLRGEMKGVKKGTGEEYVVGALKALGKSDVSYGTYGQGMYVVGRGREEGEKAMRRVHKDVNESIQVEYRI